MSTHIIVRSSNNTTLINTHITRTAQEPVELVGTAMGYGLDDGDSIPRARDVSLLHTHPASYPMGTGGSYLKGKVTGA
jgi:hypothetical protein